ncbi:uncharacterized protein LOC111340922 [Stylophora pistillata]|uniref:Perilipin-2 n=1 Tax=Stylophora pistillata TaxID=50429 RepID=A0A2B4SYA2_STYPI|nr:uncharacterized protein LOC111340922 [Stylophora pistillata]PFX34891.1 hypothetical protein AWC38_SpisGene131 [Stylophora pistillata]
MCTEVENKSFTTRLWELPVALAAVDQLSQIYSAVKERNCVTRMACNAGEKTIDMANSATKPIIQVASSCPLSKPVVECAASTIDRVASGTLDIVEEKCPIMTKTPTEIKTTVADTASEYYNKVQNSCVVQMLAAKTEEVLDYSELIAEMALPTDSNSEEDKKEQETADEVASKGAFLRAVTLKNMVKRRGTRKLLTYRPVKMSVNAVTCLQGHISDLLGKSSDCSKKVYKATMYIPNLALGLTGEVIVCTKDLVFALHQAHPIMDMPSYVANMMIKVAQPLSGATDKLAAYVCVPPQVMTEYLLTSRPVQWILPEIVPVQDLITKMDITMEEIEDTTESEEFENLEDSS